MRLLNFDDEKRLRNTSILALTEYCNITGGAIEFGNGGMEIIPVPPSVEQSLKNCSF